MIWAAAWEAGYRKPPRGRERALETRTCLNKSDTHGFALSDVMPTGRSRVRPAHPLHSEINMDKLATELRHAAADYCMYLPDRVLRLLEAAAEALDRPKIVPPYDGGHEL